MPWDDRGRHGGALTRILLALAVIAALAFPASAGHCTTWETYAADADTGIVSDATGAPRYYVADDCFAILFCQVEIIFSFWIYEEANGIPGLQRADEVVDGTCHGMIAGDRIVF